MSKYHYSNSLDPILLSQTVFENLDEESAWEFDDQFDTEKDYDEDSDPNYYDFNNDDLYGEYRYDRWVE